MSVVDSVDNILASSSANGHFARLITDTIGSTTAALTTCGYQTIQRFPKPFTVPALGGGLTGLHITQVRAVSEAAQVGFIIGLETLLGTLTVSGNSFAVGSAMPSRTIMGSSVQTAAEMLLIVATAALTATTPTLTITYTDQDGNTGNSASITLPTSPAVNSAFLVTPHLAAGDTGVRAVTNLSISAGSAGTLKAYGLSVLSDIPNASSGSAMGAPPLVLPKPKYIAVAGDVIAIYRWGSTSSGVATALISGVAES